MFINIIVFLSFIVLTCTVSYHSYVLAQLLKKQPAQRKELPKVQWKFKEKLVPSHLVEKVEDEEKKPAQNVRPLSTLESEAMEYEDKVKLIDALAQEDTTI
jgi:hypothetical protein